LKESKQQPVSSVARNNLINLNTVSLEEITRIFKEYSVGGWAKHIIYYRERKGPFSSVDQIRSVPNWGGAGKRFNSVKHLLYV
jgi:DNA uptake protein ComE-like DNA-binding protein